MDVQMQIMSAYHEAGHVVVAYWFGATLKSVEMGAHPNTKLQWPNGTTPEALVKGLVAGSLAGYKGWMHFGRLDRKELLSSFRRRDEKYTLQALQKVRNGGYATDGIWDDRIRIADILLKDVPTIPDEAYLGLVRRYEDEALELLDKPPVWRAVESVVRALLKTGRLNNDEAMAAIDKEFWESR